MMQNDRTAYLLDSNALSDILRGRGDVPTHFEQAVAQEHSIYLCQPAYYEVLRGLLHGGASVQLRILTERVRPLLQWVIVTDADWEQAAQSWADVTKRGRQLSDMDLLTAAVVMRLNAILVSADADFDALPVKREDWR